MSIATPFNQSLKPNNLEENNGIIPVQNHNPTKRTSSIGQDLGQEAAHTRILESVRRKLLRGKNSGRRGKKFF